MENQKEKGYAVVKTIEIWVRAPLTMGNVTQALAREFQVTEVEPNNGGPVKVIVEERGKSFEQLETKV